MVTRYGMSEDFDMVALETVTNQYLGGDASLACSAEYADEDRRAGGRARQARARKGRQACLPTTAPSSTSSAKYLYEKETITGEEFMKILNLEKAQDKTQD